MVKTLRFSLLSILAMLCGTLMAADVVIDFNAMDLPVSYSANADQGIEASEAGDINEAKTIVQDGVTIIISPKEESNKNANRFWKTNNGPQLRCYSGTITIKYGSAMKSIVFDAPSKFNLSADKGSIADKTWSGEATEVVFTVGGNTQMNKITVSTDGGEVTPVDPQPDVVKATCAEIIAGTDGTVYEVKGTCTEIKNTTYGNWMLKDETGEVYIYGTLDASGATKNFTSLGIEVGDVVTVQGPRKYYNGTIELVNVTVVKIEKGSTPEPKVIEVSVEEALEVINGLNDGATTTDLYDVTGIVIGEPQFDRKDDGTLYGNVNLVIGGAREKDQLTVFRGKYFENANFTEETIGLIKEGYTVTFRGNLQKYVKGDTTTPELTKCYLMSINGQGAGMFGIKHAEQQGQLYNLQGQRVATVKRGLYIRDGKKFIVK